MSGWLKIGREVLIAAAGLLYALLLLTAMLSTENRPLSIGLAIMPVLLLAIYLAWSSRFRVPLLVLLALGSGAVWWLWGEQLLQHYLWFYLLQHAGIYGALALFFGRTLWPGETPLITRLALIVHGDICAAHRRYTRNLTLIWALFFAAVVVVSVTLFVAAPLEQWALFANIVTPVSLGVMFLVEHLVRYRILPQVRRLTLIETVRIATRYFREQQPKARL